MYLLLATGLQRSYGSQVAVARFDVEIRAGETVVLLGPNGCGKTTSIEMCLGLRRADNGEASILGMNPHTQRREIARQVGIQLQGARIHPRVKVSEYFAFMSTLHHSSVSINDIVDSMGLSECRHKLFTNLSGGQQRRVTVAAALCGNPRLVVLDEPTSGVDPESRVQFWDGLRATIAKTGLGVITTTHDLNEAERYGTRILIMREGRILRDGTITELTASVPFDKVAHIRSNEALPASRSSSGYYESGYYELRHSSHERILGLASHVRFDTESKDAQTQDILLRKPCLEDVYLYTAIEPNTAERMQTRRDSHVSYLGVRDPKIRAPIVAPRSPRDRIMMAWLWQFWIQLLGFLREPAAVAFNLVVPLIIVVLQAITFGDYVVGDDMPGYRVVDLLPLAASLMYIMTLGLFGVGIGFATMIDSRTLAGSRLRRGGVSMTASAYLSVLILLLALGVVLSAVVANLSWGVHWPSRPWLFLFALIVAAGPFYACGLLFAVIAGSPRSCQAIASAAFFPCLFLSGAIFPVNSFPRGAQIAARSLPGSHAYELMAATWIRNFQIPWHSVAYLIATSLVLALMAATLLSRREDL